MIKIVHKTDSKIEPNQEEAEVTTTEENPYLDQDLMDEQNVKFSVENNKEFEDRHTVKKTAPTPLKVKVTKQQKEINFLQSELLKLRLENEKLKSISPQNETANDDKASKHIVFDENVQIIEELDNQQPEQDSFLNDAVSQMRSTRNSTPFKGKPKEKESKFTSIEQKCPKKLRSDYRITPIPQQRRRRVVFKSKLQSIADQTPNKENIAISENAETPKNIKKMETPMPANKCGISVKCEIPSDHSFNLGQRVPSSESATPSFLETPDVIDAVQLTSNGSGASNVVSPASPILTPVKGMNNGKRFEFSWNKKR